MRIGVIGTGRIGTMHARHLGDTPGVVAVHLYDELPGSAARTAGLLGGAFEVHEDLETLLAACDGVVIATTTSTHPDLLRRVVASRTPSLCEKPIASDLRSMHELVEIVEESGQIVVVGFQRRFDPQIAELKRQIDDGGLGNVYVVRATAYDAVPPDLAYIPASGGIYRDLMIHDLDAVPWLVGQPVVSVSAQGSVLVDDMFARADDVDVAAVTLTFANGTLAQLVGTRHDPLGYDHRIEVLGSRNAVAVGLDGGTPLTRLIEGSQIEPVNPFTGFAERFVSAYRAEMTTFTQIISGERDNPSPVRDSLLSLQLAEACERSRRESTPVHIGATALRNDSKETANHS